MRYVLVTGATSGVGLGTVKKLLMEHSDTFVFVGALTAALGEAARASLLADAARASLLGGAPRVAVAERFEVLELDVGSDASVRGAARRAAATLAGSKLYGIVNIAGIFSPSIKASCEVNVYGIARVCREFIPLLNPAQGRVVNITSGAGPTFVQVCSEERKAFFKDPAVTWEALDKLIAECASVSPKAMKEIGLGKGRTDAYGFSKACANSCTMILARENPRLLVNACTPGFIATDLSKPLIPKGKTWRQIGMMQPRDVIVVMQLLMGEVRSSGWFYGSDGLRSPLDKYRDPGAPPYVEEPSAKL